jgi:hypothetical protein
MTGVHFSQSVEFFSRTGTLSSPIPPLEITSDAKKPGPDIKSIESLAFFGSLSILAGTAGRRYLLLVAFVFIAIIPELLSLVCGRAQAPAAIAPCLAPQSYS